MARSLTRRSFLARSAIYGCTAAASPLLTPVSFAAAPWETRLVVILLRGGMDGIDVVQPYGDPHYMSARPTLAGRTRDKALDLDGYFAMHPGLSPLMPLWNAGDLGFVHATSTPYRDKRSHFDGQDLLEAGTMSLAGVRDGWLNRMLQVTPGVVADTAYALGRGEMKMLTGPADFSSWAPDSGFELSPQARSLAELVMRDDPIFARAYAEAARLSDAEAERQRVNGRQQDHLSIADFAANRLENEARIVAFSLNGWDMHNRQTRSMNAALDRLASTILRLQTRLSEAVWGKTAILAMTEFGRTIRENGTSGTDHGTGGAMILAGGAIRGGQVAGQWPGLAEEALYDRRDLLPTTDVRAHAAWVMRGLTGLNQGTLETTVFPGLDMGENPGLLL